jgi:hypothetical protein
MRIGNDAGAHLCADHAAEEAAAADRGLAQINTSRAADLRDLNEFLITSPAKILRLIDLVTGKHSPERVIAERTDHGRFPASGKSASRYWPHRSRPRGRWRARARLPPNRFLIA